MRLFDGGLLAFAVALTGQIFEVEAKVIFSNSPATGANLLREAFLIGNGRLGAASFGQPSMEKLALNHDSLWSGGPFESTSYNGGNPGSPTFSNLQTIRNGVISAGAGNIGGWGSTSNGYGSFRAMANMSVVISGIKSYTNYRRSLDLSTGAHTTVFTAEDHRVYTSVAYCSYPAQVCFYRLSVSNGTLPNVAFALENQLVPSMLRNATCGVGFVRLNGRTQAGPPAGMEYDVIVRLSTGPLGMPIASCSTSAPGTMVVTGSAYGPDEPLSTISLVVGAQTEYDQTKCNAASRYSCRGERPGATNGKVTAAASTRLEPKMFVTHQQDYQKLINEFNLTLNDPWAKSQYPSESLEFWQLLDRYRATADVQNKKRSVNTDQRDAQSGNKKRQTAGEAWKPEEKHQDTPKDVSGGQPFPEFNFPTSLPAGFKPTSVIPWSTSGTVVVTDYSQGTDKPQTTTITMTVPTSTSAAPTATKTIVDFPIPNPVNRLPQEQADALNTNRDAPDPGEAPDGGSYVESLLFDYARHLFISSNRDNSLPANLQGVWTDSLNSAWGADYHTNINLQMNHWFANQVGLGTQQQALWRFIKDTWVPRGQETAKLLYNAAGWVIHNEINIFGHTGMKQDPKYADYPAAAAWIMQLVYDHYDYSRDLPFLQTTGYALMRDVSTFWLGQLQQDKFSKDSTLVANPCNSPEIGPTTFGCAHFQQLIHQLFDTTLSAAWAVNDGDNAFITALDTYMSALDKGTHIGSWGQIKEWKIPETRLKEPQGDTHRHISQLVGWYPGYSIASFENGYENYTIQHAVAETLRSRGVGIGADANAGWPKLWRSACWARLNNTNHADFQLRLAIATNFAGNGLSQYNGLEGPFQIDANFGVAGAMLAMLVVDLPSAYRDEGKRSVVLGPAIPKRWGAGSVKGLRIRGGTVIDMSWNSDAVVDRVSVTRRGEGVKFFSKKGRMIGEI